MMKSVMFSPGSPLPIAAESEQGDLEFFKESFVRTPLLSGTSPIFSPPSLEPVCFALRNVSAPELTALWESATSLHTCLVRPPTPSEREAAHRRPLAHGKGLVDITTLGATKCRRESSRAKRNGRPAQAAGWLFLALAGLTASTYGGILVGAPVAAVHYGLQRGLAGRSTWGPRSDEAVHIDISARALIDLRNQLSVFCHRCESWAETGRVPKGAAEAKLIEAQDAVHTLAAQIVGNKSSKIALSSLLQAQLEETRKALAAAGRLVLLWDYPDAQAAQQLPTPKNIGCRWDL